MLLALEWAISEAVQNVITGPRNSNRTKTV
jgi:hypothetical protein